MLDKRFELGGPSLLIDAEGKAVGGAGFDDDECGANEARAIMCELMTKWVLTKWVLTKEALTTQAAILVLKVINIQFLLLTNYLLSTSLFLNNLRNL